MDVRVVGLVGLVHRLQHLARLLRAGGAVEVDERLAVDPLLQDREVRAHALDVERRCGVVAGEGPAAPLGHGVAHLRHRDLPSAPSQALTRCM